MRFAPHTADEIREMLAEVGLSSVEQLFDQVPKDVHLPAGLDLPAGVSEMEMTAALRRLAGRNRGADQLTCFAGMGAYDHYVPSVVWAIAGRSEFATSYTPYQPEISQGVLQVLFEFQSMICELTGLDVSNASVYDCATGIVEAVNMARTDARPRVLVSAGVDPRYIDALTAYGRGSGFQPEIFAGDGGRGGTPQVDADVAAVIVQSPNVYGIIEPTRELFAQAHDGGAHAIQVFDPLSLGILASPGEVGADIAVGEGQGLGNHLNFGGPYLGLMAARLDDIRRMPGRIVGETVDAEGKTGYVLTLQAREQHIRREKANSNICTNQTLMAIAATVYMAWLGPRGLEEIGKQCMSRAAYAASRLTAIPGVSLVYPDAPFFKEFALRLPAPAARVRDRLIDRGILGGVPLSQAGGDVLLVAVTEKRSRQEIDSYADALERVVAELSTETVNA